MSGWLLSAPKHQLEIPSTLKSWSLENHDFVIKAVFGVLWIQVYKQYLLWGLKYVNGTYVGLFGSVSGIYTIGVLESRIGGSTFCILPRIWVEGQGATGFEVSNVA